MKKLSFLVGMVFLFAVSCDTYEKDSEVSYTVIQATSGSNALIRAKSFLGEAASYEVTTAPTNGFTSLSTGSDSEYLTYSSLSDFSINDSFSLSAKNSSGKITGTKNFIVKKTISCGSGPAVDSLTVQAGQTIVLDLLENDYFCGIDFENALISEGANFGSGGNVTYNVDTNLGKVTLTFVADGAIGSYLFTNYTLGVNPNFDPSTATFDWRDHPEKFEKFITAPIVFNLVE